MLCPDGAGRVPEPVEAGGLRYALTEQGSGASLDVARRPQTYITSICFPLMAVVAVAYSNFHLDRDAMDTRINLVVTMILTMIALQGL